MAIKRTILSDDFSDETEETTNNNINTLNLQAMAKKTIGQLQSIEEYFSGNGGIVIFDTPTDYAVATLQTLSNPKEIGRVENASTTWTGEGVTTNAKEDEQGNIVLSVSTSGSASFEFKPMSTGDTILKKLMHATDITLTPAADDLFGTTGKAIGISGKQPPILYAPIGVLNDTQTKMLIFPKAQIVTDFDGAPSGDNYLGLKSTVTAQFIDTAGLKTVMLYGGTKVDFAIV